MPLHCQTAFVAIAALNFAEVIHFYERLLEQLPAAVVPNVYAEFYLPNLRLGIFRPRSHPDSTELSAEFAGAGVASLCLEVADLDEAIAHVTAIGAAPPGEVITAPHGREIYVYDPAGSRIILHQKNNKKA